MYSKKDEGRKLAKPNGEGRQLKVEAKRETSLMQRTQVAASSSTEETESQLSIAANPFVCHFRYKLVASSMDNGISYLIQCVQKYTEH